MNLHELPAITERTKKRVGRGTSSGRGKTSGRGVKGDKARGTSPWWKAGGSRRSRIIKHLPQLRGIGNPQNSVKPFVVTLSMLDKAFKANEVVTLEALIEKGLLHGMDAKVLNKGSLSKALTVQIPVSESAKAQIEKAGGTVTE